MIKVLTNKKPGTNAFGRAGTMGIFSIAPTIKPKGGYFTRPELRLFGTYSIWSNSLKGTTTPIGEGGNTSGAAPPYNGNTNQGWLFWKSDGNLVVLKGASESCGAIRNEKGAFVRHPPDLSLAHELFRGIGWLAQFKRVLNMQDQQFTTTSRTTNT